MVRFIQSQGLDSKLRNHDWSGFARGYNGAQFAVHNYHGRLARAFAKWQKIPDAASKKIDVRDLAEVESATHEAEVEAKRESASMGESTIGKGSQIGGGLTVAGLLSLVWEKFTSLSDSMMDKVVQLASRPYFWIMVLAIGAFAFIWLRRRWMKQILGV